MFIVIAPIIILIASHLPANIWLSSVKYISHNKSTRAIHLFVIPLTAMFMSALHPCSHTPGSLMCLFIAPTIMPMAPERPASTALASMKFLIINLNYTFFVLVMIPLYLFIYLPSNAITLSTLQPFSHTQELLICVFMVLSIGLIASISPALILFSAKIKLNK